MLTLSLPSNRLCMNHQKSGGIRGDVLVRSMEEHKCRVAVICLNSFHAKFIPGKMSLWEL